MRSHIFSGAKKVDFSKIDNRPAILIIGMNYQMAIEEYEELQVQGITELKNLDNAETRKTAQIVKAFMVNETAAKKLTDEGKIFIHKKHSFRIVRDYGKPPQCGQCNKHDHNKYECPSEHKICTNCGINHIETVCHNQAKCSNCGGEHNARSNKCREVKIAYFNLDERMKIKNLDSTTTRIPCFSLNGLVTNVTRTTSFIRFY